MDDDCTIERDYARDGHKTDNREAGGAHDSSASPRNRVEDDLTVLMMDHLAPRPGRDLRSGERVEGVVVDVVAAWAVVASKGLKRLGRDWDVADVGFPAGSGNVTHCFTVNC